MRFLEPETPQAHITAIHDEPVFYAGTGDIERIDVTASVEVQVPGTYSLELSVGGIQEWAMGELNVGSVQLSVPIPVERLRELGVGGPYKIHSARLIRQAADGRIVADNRVDLGTAMALHLSPSVGLIDSTTQAYTLASLGSPLYFTGQNSATVIRGSKSEPDRLQVQIGIYSQSADCRGYGSFGGRAQSDMTVTDPPGRRALVLNFIDKAVTQPGLYQIEQVGVICGRNFIRNGRIDIPAN